MNLVNNIKHLGRHLPHGITRIRFDEGPTTRTVWPATAVTIRKPSPLENRRTKAIERLNNLARGLGLKIEAAPYGRIAIVGKPERIEAIIERERS